MKSAKISVVAGVLMACAVLTARAEDTPAQAAARAQVLEKMKELDAQTPAAAPAAMVVAPVASVPQTSDAAAKARAKADAAAAKLKARQDAAKAAADLRAQKQAAKMAAEKAAADAAAEKKLARQMAAQKAWAAKPTPPVKTPEPSPVQIKKMDAASDLGLKPLAAPALPISGTKETRLQMLLLKYQADQVSPEEYHRQRAAILAEP